MAKKYLDENGLLYFWQKIKTLFVTDVTYNSTSRKIQKTKAGAASDVVTLAEVATSGSYEDLSNKPTIPEGVAKSTTTPKMNGTASVGSETKFAAGDHVHPSDTSRVPTTRKVNGHALSADVTVTASDIGVEDGAEVNQNAFSNVKVGTTTVEADTKTDTLELVAGSNVTITPDATNDKITIEATDTKYTAASATPLMDGTASVGSSVKYAREDHVHPTDTSRVPTTRKVNGFSLGNDVTVIRKLGDIDSGGVTLQANYCNENNTIEIYHVFDTDAVIGMFNNANTVIAQTFVPKTTTVNGNALSGDITLDADDVSAIPTSAKGAASGVCPLDANSKVDSQYLPSYVDDVIEAYPVSGATALSAGWLSATSGGSALTPEAGKIYVLMADSGDYSENTQFRWGGTTYVKLSDGGVSSITNSEIDTIVAS